MEIFYKNGNTKDCKFFKQSQTCTNKKWNVIESESKSCYSNEDPKKNLTKSIESSLGGYSDAYILVTGKIAVRRTIAAIPNFDCWKLNLAVEKKLKQPLIAATQFLFKN